MFSIVKIVINSKTGNIIEMQNVLVKTFSSLCFLYVIFNPMKNLELKLNIFIIFHIHIHFLVFN